MDYQANLKRQRFGIPELNAPHAKPLLARMRGVFVHGKGLAASAITIRANWTKLPNPGDWLEIACRIVAYGQARPRRESSRQRLLLLPVAVNYRPHDSVRRGLRLGDGARQRPVGRRRTRGLPSPSRYLAGGRRGIQIPSDGTDSAQAWHRQTQAPLRHKKHPYLPAQSTKRTQFSLVSRPSNRDLSTVSVPHATPSPGWPRLWWKTSKARRQGAPHGHAVSEAPFARPSIKGVHHAGMHA